MSPAKRSKDQDLIDRLAGQIRAPEAGTAKTNGSARPAAPPEGVDGPSDGAVIEKCRAASNAAKFSDLFDHGAVHAHNGGDDSSADLALIGMLKFWTQDPAQLERLVSDSALGRREKWRNRADYRERTVRKALAGLGEVYDWTPNGRSSDRHRHRHLLKGNDDDDPDEGGQEGGFESISFAEMGEPEPLKEVWQGVIVQGWPALWFGGTGVTKSVTAAAVAQAIADQDTHEFLGRAVISAPPMYADWELNAQVQGRRAFQIARGRGRPAPPPGDRMRYMSTYGIARRGRQDFPRRVLEECLKHKAEVCFIDSVGLAVGGNPGDFEVIIEFFEEVVADFTANGITPILIDHQRRLVAGERNQSLGAYGSVWKENLARTQLQIELVKRDREAHTVTTRLRPKKTNFGELPEPIEVITTFAEETIELEATEIDDNDLAGEETLTARDRVLAAIRTLGPVGPNAIHEACATLAKGTVKNEVGKLRTAGLIKDTGDTEPGGGRIVIVTGPFRGDDDDDDSPKTVAGLFANPPDWFTRQLKKYREDPARHLPPLCAAVAAVVLGDGTRGPEVREEVEEALEGGGGKKG